MPKFTEDQLLAIETKTKDILISAGAGSGKTTVLAERIMRKIESGRDIKDFLVVTFTNTAASDLKDKLSQRLETLAYKYPESNAYRRMLYSVSAADICTIDSFCLQYVKQNASVLGLTDGVSVGDEALCASLRASAADTVLTRLCDSDEKTADLLLDNFASHKSDNGLIETACELYGKLRAYPFYCQWFDEFVKKHANEAKMLQEQGFFSCSSGAALKDQIELTLKSAKECVDTMHICSENDKQHQFSMKLEDVIANIEEKLSLGYDQFCDVAGFPKMTRPKSESLEFVAAFDRCKTLIKSLSSYIRTKDQLLAEYKLESEVLKALYVYIVELDAEYSFLKKERGIIDFSDAEHFMLGLLMSYTDGGFVKTALCSSISALYSEVFIDEYQDVNPLQDAIFTAIGAGKRFMVGDVKQSIYGFRNAYPEIFTAYRDNFAPANDEKETASIFLKENFRCDKSIIDFCNCLFNKVFTSRTAGTDYKNERLVYGKSSSTNVPVSVWAIENANIEYEAELIAEETVKLIQSGYQPKDIALLTRKAEHLNILSDSLSKRSVPYYAAKAKKPLLNEPEVLLALSLLRVIDNPTDDISLAALLRSPIYRFTANELVQLRRGGSSLYDDVCATAKADLRFVNARFYLRGSSETIVAVHQKPKLIKRSANALSEKCRAFIEKLKIYRIKALYISTDALLWYLYEDTHLMFYAPKGNEKQHKDNLFALISLAKGIEDGVFKGVSVFIEYISRLQDSNRSPDAPSPTADNAVSLMTIHGSKGLEYPVVFVFGCGSKLIKSNKKLPVSANYRLGVSAKLANQSKAWKASTLLRDIALKSEDIRAIAEEYRVFYVAFTRARERLYISAAFKNELSKYLGAIKAEPYLYADLFLPAIADDKNDSFVLSVINGKDKDITPTCLNANILKETDTRQAELPLIQEEEAAQERLTAKYSVSQLVQDENGLLKLNPPARIDSKKPLFAEADDNAGAIRGTANHLFLQFASFDLAENDVKAEAERLLQKGFISEEQVKLLNIKALQKFFCSDIYQSIKLSPKVYREKRFTTKIDAGIFAEQSTETVLVQGVIDCFFENKDGTYTLLDYKTDAVAVGEEKKLAEKHQIQLYLYSLYIEKLTGKAVSKAYIYSLSLGKAIPCGKPKTLKKERPHEKRN